MTDRWLQSFILAADCHSFTKAAGSSFVSTMAIIQQINLMEKELGFTLFYRNHRGIQLTEEGRCFYTVAKQILLFYETGCAKAREIASVNATTFRLAYASNQFPSPWLDICGNFGRDNQSIHLQLLPLDFGEQLNAIHEAKADLCIIAEPKSEYLNRCLFEPLYEDFYSFCMSPHNPLVSKQYLTLEDVKDAHILCGHYPYMKQSIYSTLSPFCSHLDKLESEYNMSVRMDAYTSDAIFPVHTRWKDQYTGPLMVVDTNISGGLIGAVYREEKNQIIKSFLKYFSERI